jgi:branched-chain amino acid transport system permease protein
MIGIMFIVAMGGGALLGVAVERFAYRPLRNSSRLAPLISALGVSLFLQNAALLLFGARVRLYDTGQFIDLRSGISIGRIRIDPTEMMVVIGALLLMAGLWLMVNRTRLGRAMRAVAVDQDAAVMNGINVDRTVVWTFAIASGLAGAAGVMSGLLLYPVDQYMGVFAGLKGFSAAVLGGIGSIPGAMLGGFLLGITEALVTGYLNPTYADFIAFLILILVLLIRPRGILGRPAIAKV